MLKLRTINFKNHNNTTVDKNHGCVYHSNDGEYHEKFEDGSIHLEALNLCILGMLGYHIPEITFLMDERGAKCVGYRTSNITGAGIDVEAYFASNRHKEVALDYFRVNFARHALFGDVCATADGNIILNNSSESKKYYSIDIPFDGCLKDNKSILSDAIIYFLGVLELSKSDNGNLCADDIKDISEEAIYKEIYFIFGNFLSEFDNIMGIIEQARELNILDDNDYRECKENFSAIKKQVNAWLLKRENSAVTNHSNNEQQLVNNERLSRLYCSIGGNQLVTLNRNDPDDTTLAMIYQYFNLAIYHQQSDQDNIRLIGHLKSVIQICRTHSDHDSTAVFSQLLCAVEPTAENYCLTGLMFYQAGYCQKATDYFQHSIKEEDNPESHYYLALIALDEGEENVVSEHFNQATRIVLALMKNRGQYPSALKLLLNIAAQYSDLAYHEEALFCAKKLIAAQGENVTNLYLAANSLYCLGQYDGAFQYLKSAKSLLNHQQHSVENVVESIEFLYQQCVSKMTQNSDGCHRVLTANRYGHFSTSDNVELAQDDHFEQQESKCEDESESPLVDDHEQSMTDDEYSYNDGGICIVL